MTIHELIAALGLNADDEIPIWVADETGEPTKKITAQNMANSVKSLASLPNTTEMNDAIAQSTAFLSEDGYKGPKHNNLNTLYADMSDNTFGMSLFVNAANAPTTGDGLVISQKASDNYGGQFIIMNTNAYYRNKNDGIWSDWFGINNQIKVKILSVDYSMPANGSYNTNLKTLIDADLPSGYKCVGISGFTTNNVNVLPISVRYDVGQYSFQLRNLSSSSTTGTAGVYYMYTPN